MYIEVFYWRSGGNVVHRGASVNSGVRLTAEGCNFDDASPRYETHRVASIVDNDTSYCERCMPPERITEEAIVVPV